MKTGNRIAKITVIIEIVLSMLVGRVKSSGKEEKERLLSMYGYTHMYMPFSTIVKETSKLRLEDYAKKETYYEFVKNLLTDENDELNSKNTEDIITTEFKKHSARIYNCIYTCFYREVEENGEITKKYIPYEEATEEDKKILITPYDIDSMFLALVQEARNRIVNPEKDTKIKTAIELVKRVLNRSMCRFYIDNAISNVDQEIKNIKSLLENIGMTKTTAYSLFSKANICSIQDKLTYLFRDFRDIVRAIKKVPQNNDLFDLITDNTEKEMKRIFSEDSRRIAAQIMDRRQNYNIKTAEEIRNDFSDDLEMFINILTDGKVDIDFHMYISKEQLKKEIDKIEDDNIKFRLYEAVVKCLLKYNGKLTIDRLRSEINNSNANLSCLIERRQIEIEPSTSKETEEKTNKMFNSIISSDSVKFSMEVDEIVKEAKPWNRDLVSLMCKQLVEYTKFNGTEEELIGRIAEDNAQIASEAIDKREKWYNTHKNVSAIQSIVENELKKIKRIIKKRKTTVKLEKDVIAEEIEEIIALFENISNKPDDVTEEEKQVRKALEYISKGEYNSEEEQRIVKVLYKIARGEYRSKEKNTQRHIRSIVSEIAEEFIKDEDYQVTDERINNKKQEIVDMVVEKLPVITEDKDVLKMKKRFREIVEGTADVLINRMQYKEFNKIENEIEIEENYIKSQDLISSFDSVFEFLEKHANLDLNGHLFLYGYELSFLSTYITQMKEAISTGPEETVNFFLLENSYKKLSDFLSFFEILYKLDVYIDILKTYNAFWLNPSSFNYYKGVVIMHLDYKFSMAYIDYKNTIKEKMKKKEVTPTNENLQSFIRARTVQDIVNIDEVDE